ncbi:MAG: ester cyclase [Acidobacteriaceae bacterium]
MPLEKNKALVRRFFEDAPYHPEACHEIFAEKIPWHALYHTDHPDFVSDPQAEKEAYAHHIRLWGGWSESIDEIIAEGDRVVVRWTFRGTHQGEYLGMPPTQKPVVFSGIYIFRIAEHRIAEVWNLWDQLGEWQQLGILPTKQEILHPEKDLEDI